MVKMSQVPKGRVPKPSTAAPGAKSLGTKGARKVGADTFYLPEEDIAALLMTAARLDVPVEVLLEAVIDNFGSLGAELRQGIVWEHLRVGSDKRIR